MNTWDISGHCPVWMRPALWILAGCVLGVGISQASAGAFTELSSAASETNSTVITSTRLTFDQQKRTAIFEEQVVVIDPQVKITADKLTVLFSEDNKVTSIEAQGKVVIQQGEKKATCEMAQYEVNDGKFVLTGHPWVENGRDTLSADIITFWRNSNRILCEPNARLVIRSEQEVFKDGFMKE
ncbi:MAG: hypothetical protein KKE37_12195 [Verrucomicrobia bacterium]|nr:hypothetical protein [Verrucomicrobiota bacterium]MBU4289649.1 hypothetical protein [Verrucomicrobiota bacterium]MBU4430097.1 hypothetical protein [Verrucomicrobiota bacterium]MCG2681347.1 hypothetical protein [Kiritimatiellia bacterium]